MTQYCRHAHMDAATLRAIYPALGTKSCETPPGLRVGQSTIAGLGLFTTAKIPAKKQIVVYEGEIRAPDFYESGNNYLFEVIIISPVVEI